MTEQTNEPHRSWGEHTPEDDRTLYWAVSIGLAVLVFAAIGTVGYWVGWWTFFLATLASIVVAGSTLLLFFRRKDQDGAAEPHGENTSLLARFGYDDMDEMRGISGSPAQPTSVQVTEEEIDEVEAIMKFAADDTAGEAVEPPPPSKWRWLSVPFIWVLMLWPVYFWPRYFWQYLCQHPSEDATDRAEDWMWWVGSVTIPGIMFLGWNSKGSSMPFWLVLVSYAGSGLFLWAMLTFRRSTTT
ncbi:MAG: hypothetical protein ACK4SL_01590 [Candidatus Paceibacteria bacterium]